MDIIQPPTAASLMCSPLPHGSAAQESGFHTPTGLHEWSLIIWRGLQSLKFSPTLLTFYLSPNLEKILTIQNILKTNAIIVAFQDIQ